MTDHKRQWLYGPDVGLSILRFMNDVYFKTTNVRPWTLFTHGKTYFSYQNQPHEISTHILYHYGDRENPPAYLEQDPLALFAYTLEHPEYLPHLETI